MRLFFPLHRWTELNLLHARPGTGSSMSFALQGVVGAIRRRSSTFQRFLGFKRRLGR